MSGFQDVRDVMDISGPSESTPRAPPLKKQKTVEKRPGVFINSLIVPITVFLWVYANFIGNRKMALLVSFSRYWERILRQ